MTTPKEKALVVDDESADRYTLIEAPRPWEYDPLEASAAGAPCFTPPAVAGRRLANFSLLNS